MVWSAGSSSVAIWCAQTHAHLRSVLDTGEADEEESAYAGKNMGGVASAGSNTSENTPSPSLRASRFHVHRALGTSGARVALREMQFTDWVSVSVSAAVQASK